MVRTQNKKSGSRAYKYYDENKINEALTKMAIGEISILVASKLYEILYRTLHNTLDCMDCCNGGDSIVKDFLASFKATGIFPLNKEKVLDKLLIEDNADLIKDTVINYLKGQRYSNLDENSRKKIRN